MFKLHVEFQGCPGCRMPESKSKELCHFTSSMTCEDLSFADGKTRAGGYPHLSTWSIVQRYKISPDQLQVELWPPEMAFSMGNPLFSLPLNFLGSGSPSCRINTFWSPWIQPCYRGWIQILAATTGWAYPKRTLGVSWVAVGVNHYGAHDWKWNQQQIEGLVWSSPWIPCCFKGWSSDMDELLYWVPSSQDKSHIQL